MKVKYLAAACAALCSVTAFAAPLATNTGVPAGLVTYYIAGASAQAQAVSKILPTSAFFAVPADVVKLTGGSAADARFGMSNPDITGGTSKPLLVVYRNSNGSGSGVRQLLSTSLDSIAALPNVGTTVIKNDNTNLVTLASCGPVTGTSGTYTAACTSTEARVPDIALADVNPVELGGSFAGLDLTLADLVSTKNALQGFGIVANPNLYAALQNQNVREGLLPNTCDDNATEREKPACQPSIRKNDYTGLIAAEGSIADANALLATTGDSTVITVCRRTNASGTQASSNIFFLNNTCGTVGFQGAYNPLGAEEFTASKLINEGSSTTNVKTCVNGTSGYRLGVVSLENIPSGSDLYKFVKIDGVSPNYTYNGTALVADPMQRQQFASGAYQFAYELYTSYRNGAPDNVVAFATAVNGKLGDSTLSDLIGIAYEDGQNLDPVVNWTVNSTANKQSRVTRQGNNCGPLIP